MVRRVESQKENVELRPSKSSLEKGMLLCEMYSITLAEVHDDPDDQEPPFTLAVFG